MFPKSMCNVRKICDTIFVAIMSAAAPMLHLPYLRHQQNIRKFFDIFTFDKRKNTDFDINWLKMTFSPR